MKFARTLSAVALLVALMGAWSMPAFAEQVRRTCLTKPHDCCRTPLIKTCCSDQDNTSNPKGPVESRIQISPNLTPSGGMFLAGLSSEPPAIVRPQTTPPRAGPADLPTLLSTLLL